MDATQSPVPVAPRVVESSQAAERDQKLAQIGGNVGAIWRGWWTWGPGNGVWNLQIPWNVIGVNSTVVITASEIDGNGNRFVGAASFQVSSIAPAAGVVTFKINIDWSSPLPMRTDVVVFN